MDASLYPDGSKRIMKVSWLPSEPTERFSTNLTEKPQHSYLSTHGDILVNEDAEKTATHPLQSIWIIRII
jgi:hypothetical protein